MRWRTPWPAVAWGLRTRLSVGRRLYYIVFVTEMDGLVTVPRRKRYLPMLAGMLTDLLVLAVLILLADVTRRPGGALSLAGDVALAFAYMTRSASPGSSSSTCRPTCTT